MIRDVGNIVQKTNKQWRPMLLVYFIQLFFGLFVAVFAYKGLEQKLGSSMELERLANGFDRSIFSDMLNQSPQIIEMLLDRFSITILIFLIISIFFHAGLIGNLRRNEYSIHDFIKNGKEYFIKFTGIALITLLKMGVVLILIWKPFISWIGDPLQTFHSDKSFILTTMALVIITVLLLILIWLWSVLARYSIVDGDDFVKAMKSSWSKIKSAFFKYFPLGVLVVLLHLLMMWLYTLIVDDWGASTWFCVLGLISIQQMFSWLRIWLRTFAYSLIGE